MSNKTSAGLVVSDYGQHYWIESYQEDQSVGRWLCSTPRSLRSAVLVGDHVQFEKTGPGTGQVLKLEPRKSVLYRQDRIRTKAFAANLDQVIWVMASEPVFSEEQLTRTLIAAEAAELVIHLILNKSDLNEPFTTAKARLAPYEQMGYSLTAISCKDQPELAHDTLAKLCEGKASLILGASGVGKSSLTNLFLPDEKKAATQNISTALKAGKHTTTATHWYWIDASRSSALIDSPGFQVFGLHHVAASNLASLMPDIAPFASQCQFHNCTHRQEPGCAVKAQLESGNLSPNRYRLYCALFEELSAPPF